MKRRREERYGSQVTSDVSCSACIILAAVLLTPLACASASHREAGVAARFVCASGATFQVTYAGRRAHLVTPAASYRLSVRRSSIGRKFAAGEVVFIHDGAFGALNGAAGGPFRRCFEAGANRPAGHTDIDR